VFLACRYDYSQWRLAQHSALHDGDTPPERLVQNIWHHQRIRRDDLKLTDGRSIRILHPGFWVHGAGPDFRNAMFQVGTDPPVTGDIEIDLHAHGWRDHGHHQNPNFASVGLHVVWEGPANPLLPTLALRAHIDAPLAELALWLAGEAAKNYPEDLLGQCAKPLRAFADSQLEQLLSEAAKIRLERKAGDLQARARQAGWDQSLWEGMLRGLGYKQNIWPMQRIGELRERLRAGNLSFLESQARLLGVSGLLPHDLTRKQRSADKFLRRTWDCWWRERDDFDDCSLPRPLWRLHGIRPANHPQRRLALAAHWMAMPDLFSRIQNWFTNRDDSSTWPRRLLEILQPVPDEFWARHWTLRSASMPRAQPLLGTTRLTDLAINVIIPWLWARAREGHCANVLAQAERAYFEWPAAEDNAVLRLARDRLLGGRHPVKFRTAALQQGLLQVIRDFCDHSNALCAECRFPELVRSRLARGES
jgi:hypothetical protein